MKGGTFTYNGGEAMTSASVPVDAEVKVTLNQSAVPEGMVFDLWAMDEASLLGNPAVAYNQESFTIPAGSVAKGSTELLDAINAVLDGMTADDFNTLMDQAIAVQPEV